MNYADHFFKREYMKHIISRGALISIAMMAANFSGLFAMQEIASMQQYNSMIKQSRPTVILFYSPTCPVCRAFKPNFSEVAKQLSTKAQFLAINGTNSDFRDLLIKNEIQEVPVVIYGAGSQSKDIGYMDKEDFLQHVQDFLKTAAPRTVNKTVAKKQPQNKIKNASAKTQTPTHRRRLVKNERSTPTTDTTVRA